MPNQLIPAVKGTRDFYPEDMPFRNWLYSTVKKISEKFGYQEFDGPLIEYLDLYADKTSEEILKDQAFSLKDRDGRDILLRPEITPTFVRMVAQRQRQLTLPIRWYSFGRGYRYEQPQKGRGREFFQWEINILGPENAESDAEIFAIAVEFFKQANLTPDEIIIRLNDRSFFEQILKENEISLDKFTPLLRIVDRKEKISPEEFGQALKNEGLTAEQIAKLISFFQNKDYSLSKSLTALFDNLKNYPGVLDYIEFDPTITRGLDYYTGTVFEAWDKTGGLKRALFGGGRYDNLTESLGGDRLPGVGMAIGDMAFEALLEQFNKIPPIKPKVPQVLVTVFAPDLMEKSTQISSQLRSSNIDTELWVDPNSKLDKQLKYANQKGIPFAVIIGPDEVALKKVVLKNLDQRSQETLSLDELLPKLRQ